jgi:hypothetical protein
MRKVGKMLKFLLELAGGRFPNQVSVLTLLGGAMAAPP